MASDPLAAPSRAGHFHAMTVTSSQSFCIFLLPSVTVSTKHSLRVEVVELVDTLS